MVNIDYHILEQEDAERAAAAERAAREQRKTALDDRTAAQLAAVKKQIAEVKAQLEQGELAHHGDDPALWPLRKKLVSLWNKHRELEGGM